MDLVRAISTLRDAAGMTNQELIERSEMSASYFYGRLRGAAPFDANDIEKLAQALGTHPHEISRVAASIGDTREIEPVVETDAKELGRRLTAASHAPRLDGSAFDVDGLINELAERYDLAGTYAAICFVILVSICVFILMERLERWLRPAA